MASSFSTTISLAASKLAGQPQPALTQQTQVVQTGQVIAATQLAAQTSAVKVEINDKNRSTQVPKRTEGSFANQAIRKKPEKEAPVEKREEKDPHQGHDQLDVVA